VALASHPFFVTDHFYRNSVRLPKSSSTQRRTLQAYPLAAKTVLDIFYISSILEI
jgi:hypothetical protein